jgi:eukaryotic-like serine/threonine-protein kinase
MGEVWRATDEVLGRTVAVKVVLPALLDDPGFLRRFLAEARAMASINHPGVVAVHDYGSDAAGAFLVMEYVDGEPLSTVLARAGRLTPAGTMRMVAQAGDALQAAHERGIVHRDVKPANLLVRRDGTLILTDFGIASSAGAALTTGLTSTGAILGTPSYLAPEQVLGEPATPLSDVYALGVVAYECLSGRRPFQADNAYAVAMKRLREPPPPFGPEVPPAMAAVVDGALATDPAARWPSAAAFAAVARDAMEGRTPTTRAGLGRTATTGVVVPAPTPATEVVGGAPARRPRRRGLVAAVAVVLGLVALGGGLWVALGGRGGAADPGGRPSGSAAATGPGATLGPGSGVVPAGFVACGPVFCPPTPRCWGGLTIPGGVGREPRRIECAELHYWQTFAVAHLPSGAEFLRQERLMDRPDIAAVCSDAVLSDRSLDAAATQGWRREPWPVQVDPDTWIMYCLAGPAEGGEWTGSRFRDP